MDQERGLRAYEWGTGILGAAILVHAAAVRGLDQDWLLVTFWSLAHLFFADKGVLLLPDVAFIPGYPITIAALATTGLAGLAPLVVSSMIWNGVCKGRSVSRIAFNIGHIALAAAAARGVAILLWGTCRLDHPVSPQGLVHGLVIVLTFHAVFTAAHTLHRYLRDPAITFHLRLGRALARSLKAFVPSYYFFSVLLVHLVQTGGPIAGFLFLSAIYALWQQFYLVNAYREEVRKATTDALTALANREGLERSLDIMLRKDRFPVSVLFVDIDDFKRVNDTYGHDTGDRVLRTIGTLLRDFVREDDVAARWGGEEFVVVLWRTPLAESFQIAERIRNAVRSTSFPEGVHISVSIGCAAAYAPDDVSRLLSLADSALYRAKGQGKDRVFVAAASSRE
ncbi:MAG: GGDEF domain-containing protein [Bacillota bacterium]|nr:GGDEF domain-containing protein [Bacillota bacterium]